MKIKKMYLEDFIKECDKLNFTVIYNDETGIFYIPNLNIRIRKWNNKIVVGTDFFGTDELNNFLKLYKEVQYYIELDDESNENK